MNEIFVAENGELIEWRFIVQLHLEQKREGLKFANKLSVKRIEYHRCKMKVNLAAQTLSSSVADALAFLQSKNHPNFQGSDGTIKFIRIVDRLFDLLNSRSPHGKGFKSPMRRENVIWCGHQ